MKNYKDCLATHFAFRLATSQPRNTPKTKTSQPRNTFGAFLTKTSQPRNIMGNLATSHLATPRNLARCVFEQNEQFSYANLTTPGLAHLHFPPKISETSQLRPKAILSRTSSTLTPLHLNPQAFQGIEKHRALLQDRQTATSLISCRGPSFSLLLRSCISRPWNLVDRGRWRLLQK